MRLAPTLAVAAVLCALAGLPIFGLGWGIGLFPGANTSSLPLNSAALVLIGSAAFLLRSKSAGRWIVGLALIAALLTLTKQVLYHGGWITTPTLPGNAIMISLLALSLVLVVRRNIIAAQLAALLSMLPSSMLILDRLYTFTDYDGSVAGVVFSSGLLSAVAILCGTASRGPMRHFLAPDPHGQLQRLRLAALTAAAIGLGFVVAKLNFHSETLPVIVTAFVAIIVVFVSDISGYLSRVDAWRMESSAPVETAALAASIDEALARGDFRVHFQPQIDLPTDRVVGMEALVRWHSPEHGTIQPATFIPTAEASGLIVPLGRWVLESACEQAMRWRGTVLGGVDMSVNVSPVQLRTPGFVEDVRGILCRTGFPPQRLVLELTESALVRRGEVGFDVLWALHEQGLRIAIDDFGTGYSCLAYLRDLPVSSLKIDQSFVQRLPDGESDAIIARSIVGLGRGLGLTIVAEGVETVEQADFLKGIWCDKAQGYLYARPLDADGALAWAMGIPAGDVGVAGGGRTPVPEEVK
jgi:EAL domain-containing protein (putative c-di-GMP-specific phosphodiesterase class I)